MKGRVFKMTIQSIGPIDPISKYKKVEKTEKPQKNGNTDSISLSAEAKAKAEIYQATETVKNTPDIRKEKIEEVKKKLEDPTYISDKVIEVVAEKILDFLEI